MTEEVKLESVTVTETQRVVVEDKTKGTVIVTGALAPSSSYGIYKMNDVDFTNLVDGCTLVYQQIGDKWLATNKLEKQIMNGGFF